MRGDINHATQEVSLATRAKQLYRTQDYKTQDIVNERSLDSIENDQAYGINPLDPAGHMKNKNNQNMMTSKSWLPIVGAEGYTGSGEVENQARGGNEIDNGGKRPQFNGLTSDKELRLRKNNAHHG